VTSPQAALRPVRGTAEQVLALLRDWDAAEDPEPLAVETSGSTGSPKRVLLSRAAMRASADATHARLDGPGQWLLTLPATYVAGLQVLFRSVRAGTEPVLSGDGGAAAVAAAAASMTGGPRYVSVVPTQLHRLVRSEAGRAALAGFDAVLVGGASLDPALRAEAEEAGGRVVTTYGMSETCGGCVYDGRPLDGVELEVGAGGRVLVRGPVLFDGYDDPGLTAEVMREGWFVTQDRGRVGGGGRVEVLGRADDVVVSGGVNVPTGAVAARVRAHPGVRAAEVVGVVDDDWGTAVVAVLVGDVDRETLRDWVAGEHPRSWAPQRVVRVEALPLLPNGKVDRLSVRRLAGA